MDIPVNVFAEVMHHTKAETRHIALITIVMDYNRRMCIAGLVKHLGAAFHGVII